jgi:hypothetical protein
VSNITFKKSKCFNIYSIDENHSFFHVQFEDSDEFFKNLFDYFFSENNLIKYCEHNKHLKFQPSDKNYVILYKHLQTYLDEKNKLVPIEELEEILLPILEEEYGLEDEQGKKLVRIDKMGKIGEYLFCCLLSDVFQFDCIIPKVHLQTNYNMSVFGIDTLYYSTHNNLILFGESKFSLSLENGLGLIKTSLKKYEKQIKDEFKLVLSNRLYKDKLNLFDEKYGDIAEISIDIDEFIVRAEIKTIGIPLFIAHGKEIDKNEILKKLQGIERISILGLEPIYYFISLPIIDKNKLIAIFTHKIKEMEDYYESKLRQH